jgi:hypothetical protein
LVSNELAIEPSKPPGESQATETKKPDPAEKPLATRSAFSADVLPTVPPVAAEPAAKLEPVTPGHDFPTQPDSAISVVDELPDLAAEPLSTPAEPPTAAKVSKIPAEGLQQELPYLEDIPPTLSANPPAPTPEAAEFQMAGSPLEDLPTGELPLIEVNIEVNTDSVADSGTLAPASITTAGPAPAEDINWDDIPVLEEAVDLAEEIAADAAAHGGVTPTTAATLPPADAARRLAIQVAARLNVELRKSGQAGLSSDIITRLARLLQEALAKGTANMENSPPDKH